MGITEKLLLSFILVLIGILCLYILEYVRAIWVKTVKENNQLKPQFWVEYEPLECKYLVYTMMYKTFWRTEGCTSKDRAMELKKELEQKWCD